MSPHELARSVVFAAFCLSLIIGVTGWLVRTRRISPFSSLGRILRSVSEPFTAPIERRLVRAGGNPVHAGWWLVVGVAVVGVVALSLWDWVAGVFWAMSGAANGGPRAVAALVIEVVYNVLVVALLVRVIGTWFGAFAYSRWMRPAYLLTDWLVEPLRRVIPPFGMMDVSPLAAWLVLWILQRFLLSVL